MPKAQRTRKPNRALQYAQGEISSFLREVDRRIQLAETNPHGNQRNPLDELVFIILSAQTESYLYRQTYRDLRAAYTPWTRLIEAPIREIASVIRRGGLARKKAAQLQAAFREIVHVRGKLSLRFLHKHADAEVLKFLTSLPGVGVKTAKCVMMYSLDRPVFPVDTHVWRVARRLGIAEQVPKPSDAQECELERRIPKDLRYPLHVKLVSLGKTTCRTYFPKCDSCVLAPICPSDHREDSVWSGWRRPRGVWAQVLPAIDRRRAQA